MTAMFPCLGGDIEQCRSNGFLSSFMHLSFLSFLASLKSTLMLKSDGMRYAVDSHGSEV